MTEEAIVKTNGIQLANFGGRDEIRELTERIKLSLPGGIRYSDIEARTLAQISIAHDLDPFNGECWLIKDEKKNKVYGALIGIKGHRKHAKKQANYWGVGADGGFERITDPKMLEEIKAPTGSIVYTYSIMDDVTLGGYTDSLERFTKLGFDLETAQKMIGGPPPKTIGIGIWSPGEQTKMKPVQCAMFRAEKDALKRRFDVQFSIEINGRALPVEIHADLEDEPGAEEIEAEYLEVESRDEAEILEELGFTSDDIPEETESHQEIEYEIVDLGLAENFHAARNALKHCETDDQIAFMRAYRGWRDMGADVKQASDYANAGEAPK